MNRRGFLASLGIALGSVAAAPVLSLVPKPEPLGISIRFVKEWDALPLEQFQARYVRPAAQQLADTIDARILASMRMDVIYGFATFNPDFACRISA